MKGSLTKNYEIILLESIAGGFERIFPAIQASIAGNKKSPVETGLFVTTTIVINCRRYLLLQKQLLHQDHPSRLSSSTLR